jgi:hypothetical protein
MLHLLKRHIFPVTAFFRKSLVLTYAFPPEILEPLLLPGLTLDTFRGNGFLAIALVQTEGLRPSFLPAACGSDFFLGGYRIFTRLATPAGSRRGLRILRSSTDRRFMVRAGNLFTHYQYELCDASVTERSAGVEWNIRTPSQQADLEVVEHPGNSPSLPAGSPFANQGEARRFAGPLPYTFTWEPETQSIISVLAKRRQWDPEPAAVEVRKNTFLNQEPYCFAPPILASAFRVREIPYQWLRGTLTPVEAQ